MISIGILISTTTVSAQIQGVAKGDRVKIDAPSMSDRRIIGTVLDNSGSVTILAVRNDSTYYIPNSSIRKLSVSAGKKRKPLKGALLGAGSGGLLLGIIAAATNPDPKPCEGELFCGSFELTDGEAFVFGAVLGILAGGAVGAITGALVETEKWVRVPLGFSMGIQPSVYQDKFALHPTVSIQFSLSK
ncbi:hypothetical protein NC796_07015 [Aliifodinibius sp. S!AR15-10]|nr:hypothetical protein [Aliifodinibius sp. S!AR15-10]